MTWASNHDGGLPMLERVQQGLTVDLIMVARRDFHSCRLSDTAAAVKAANQDKFSFIPVLDKHDHVVGLYDAEQWFVEEVADGCVADDYQPLSETILIGVNATLLDFVQQADAFPTRLVVSGDRIAGLVSISDMQQLPVRAALFSMITSFELAMARAISHEHPKPESWIGLLSPGRQTKLQKAIDDMKHNNSFVDEITATQFSDKWDILAKMNLFDCSQGKLRETGKLIRKLRDDLAHGSHYADNPDNARLVSKAARDIYAMKTKLNSEVWGLRRR